MESELTDEECARLAQGGDERAFAILFTRYSALVKNVILHKSANCDADEVVQTVFVEAWRKISDYDPEKGKIKAWIIHLAQMRFIDQVRRYSARSRAHDRLELSLNHRPTHNGTALPEMEVFGTAAMWGDRLLLIQEAMSAIPPLQAQVLRLMLDGLSQRDIAEQLEKPLGTVKTRLELGIKALQRVLKHRGYLKSIAETAD